MQQTATIVVIAWADDDTVRSCIHAICRARERLSGGTELVVVENRPYPRGIFPEDAVVLRPGRNLGFAPAAMLALREATGGWVAFVNDDCTIDERALTTMLGCARASDDTVGAVAGLMLFADRPGIVNVAGLEVDELGVASERLVGRPVAEAERCEVFGASAGFALYRRKMLDEIGGFDETFFAYLEDADLAWRARMAGWTTIFEPGAQAHHLHSTSVGHASATKHLLVGRNRVRMLAKNATRAQLLTKGAWIVLYDVAYVLYAAAQHRTLAPLRGRVAGVRDWRRYRSTGSTQRRAAPLVKPNGLRAAIGRDRAYRGFG